MHTVPSAVYGSQVIDSPGLKCCSQVLPQAEDETGNDKGDCQDFSGRHTLSLGQEGVADGGVSAEEPHPGGGESSYHERHGHQDDGVGNVEHGAEVPCPTPPSVGLTRLHLVAQPAI